MTDPLWWLHAPASAGASATWSKTAPAS